MAARMLQPPQLLIDFSGSNMRRAGCSYKEEVAAIMGRPPSLMKEDNIAWQIPGQRDRLVGDYEFMTGRQEHA